MREPMTQEQLEKLQDLVRDWRRRDFGTGDASYDYGQESARDCCADALDELLAEWKTEATLEPLEPM